jgi:hypothetical protein
MHLRTLDPTDMRLIVHNRHRIQCKVRARVCAYTILFLRVHIGADVCGLRSTMRQRNVNSSSPT